ncbi:MAG: 16S rRNA (cytidine(1402)-2'-O)-methyltransferase [Acidobacteriota bacterium]|nr:16S rRNA (cytidine(1402)-2'-O)-methyltransferase [Blastocatellia bacterium]MDW8239872.1 16S rRNA (cytidine(1402)-2'-O)-methyltransferase [Acidobacteriota bacterium]
MAGTLYVVATPIGHLEDITYRAVRILGEVDLIACEDTRQTRKLLTRYQIATPTISYHEHNERQRARYLIEQLEAGRSVALVSDAGTPTIADPGLTLIQQAIAHNIRVVPIPGPSALITALMAAGISAEPFLFIGFLPARQSARRNQLEALRSWPYTLICYEAPHRIRAALKDMLLVWGDRQVVLARELTKLHEEFHRGHLSELAEQFHQRSIKGEIVLVVAGATTAEAPSQRPTTHVQSSIYQRVMELMQANALSLNAAIKQVSQERRLSKKSVYHAYIQQRPQERNDGG